MILYVHVCARVFVVLQIVTEFVCILRTLDGPKLCNKLCRCSFDPVVQNLMQL